MSIALSDFIPIFSPAVCNFVYFLGYELALITVFLDVCTAMYAGCSRICGDLSAASELPIEKLCWLLTPSFKNVSVQFLSGAAAANAADNGLAAAALGTGFAMVWPNYLRVLNTTLILCSQSMLVLSSAHISGGHLNPAVTAG